jgi:Flp pilus assembly protein TadG
MRVSKRAARRPGAALVEAALVIPLLFALLFVIICGAMLVITADEVAGVTREGARYASVRGSSYAFNTKQPAATPEDVANYVKGLGATLDPARLTCTVTWQGSNRPGQYVTVEVRYRWPGLGFFGAQEFVARSTMLVSY